MDNIYDKIKFLINYLNECTKAYDEGNPKISDSEWDKLYFELKELENQYGLIFPNSPTQTISYEVVSELNKIEHNHKMLSLDKTKSTQELQNFLGKKSFLAMCKMDGLTCSLTYQNGELISAETRGNGLVGEDILHNARVLSTIPKRIPYMEDITIDGEIICTYKNFEKVSNEYKNSRNFAAGSIRLLNSKECQSRNLSFVAWDLINSIYNDSNIECNLEEKLNLLSTFGFTLVPYITCSSVSSIEELETIINNIKTIAEDNSFPIDGVVFKFLDCAYGRSLGETAHHFKNAIAYKFYDEVYETRLRDIEWSMGRTGVLTPVAIFDSVDIDGAEVSRASLHNISVMTELLGSRPHPDQKIWVYKSNMIIPQIYEADKSIPGTLYYMENQDFEIPSICPVCGGHTEESTYIDSTVLKCLNPDCSGKLINKIDHFCGKKGLDIKGISKATLEKLIDWGWLSTVSDIYSLSAHRGEWIIKPGFGEKSVDKILSSISASRNCELQSFICALGINLIGSTASKEIAKHFKTWGAFVSAAENDFAFYQLPNFGIEMHKAIVNFNYAEAKYIAENYIHFNEYLDTQSSNDLSGLNFVITGKLKNFKNRDELKSKIESYGGKVVGSVSKNTSYLINNDVNSNSSKNLTAKSLSIPILSEEDFIQTFGISI